MKRILCISLFFLLAATICNAQASKDQLVTLEKQAWDAFKNQQAKVLVGMISKEFLNIRQDGTVLDRSGVVQAMYEYEIKDLNLSDFRLFVVDADAAFIVYKLTATGSRKGQPLPPINMQASTLYVHSAGKWLPKFHQETPIVSMQEAQTQTEPVAP